MYFPPKSRDSATLRRSAEHSSFQHFSFTKTPLSPATPISLPSGPATGSFNGLHLISNFLAFAGYPGISDPASTADPDGDGWSNHDEWVTGNNPTLGSSRFTTTVSTAGISFTRVPGRTYQVVTSTTFASPWVFLANVPAGSGPVTVPPPANSGPRRFYKVVISCAP